MSDERPGVLIDDNEVVRLLAQNRKKVLPRQERKCLGKCGGKFMSKGIGNRVCEPCKALAPWKAGNEERTARERMTD